jgi:peptidoglycan/xylan/chitin deacetylase (PgdA/CDA1 family)
VRARLAAISRRLPGGRPRAVVLVYHRVRERGLDPWRLTVDPEIFAGQMETLARDWTPISLSELVEGFARRQLPERAVAVTFDDGYADNLETAAPILVELGIPATLFVAADLVDAGGPPWWDQLVPLLLEPARLPPTLTRTRGVCRRTLLLPGRQRRGHAYAPSTRSGLRCAPSIRRREMRRSTRSPSGRACPARPSVSC